MPYGKTWTRDQICNARKQLLEIEHTLETIPDNLPGDLWMDGSGLRLHLPYDIQILRDARQVLGTGWKFQGSYIAEQHGWRMTSYISKQTGCRMLITLMPEEKGATCQRVQVGEQAIPVYKVVCS